MNLHAESVVSRKRRLDISEHLMFDCEDLAQVRQIMFGWCQRTEALSKRTWLVVS